MAKASDNVFPRLLIGEGGSTSTPAAAQVTVYAKADGLLYSKDDAGTETLMSSGPGALTHSFLGYNTIGGTAETPTLQRVIMKKITVAAAGILASVEAYMYENGAAAEVASVPEFGVWTDVAGVPSQLLRWSGAFTNDSAFLANDTSPTSADGRWFGAAMGLYVPAADYWIGFSLRDIGSMKIVYDGSGSDQYFQMGNGGGGWISDGDLYSRTTTSNRYSIRASFIA